MHKGQKHHLEYWLKLKFGIGNDMLKMFKQASTGNAMAETVADLEGKIGDLELFKQMADQLPINLMVADLEKFEVFYANPATFESLKTIEHLLPIKASEIVGTCIDVFHKNPQMQRGMLGSAANLPHKADIQVGDQILELNVSALHDGQGNYSAAMVTWTVVTEHRAAEKKSLQLAQMLDQLPINVMFCDPQTLVIEYMNKTSQETLNTLAHLLPCPPNQILGSCIDIFHKNPSHQRNILADKNNLPMKSNIKLGEHTLSLEVTAMLDEEGNYLKAVLGWSVITDQVAIANKVKGVANAVAAATEELSASASGLSKSVDWTREAASGVAATAEQSSVNLNTVASATEELSSTTNEISRQVQVASDVAKSASSEATESSLKVQTLSEAASKIGEVVNLINDIAEQTNLLALNATIEAARAGEAGKGFAVVASEVKSLATQTAKATEDITVQIQTMQNATSGVVESIDKIGATIEQVNDTTNSIASAAEEQSVTTREIASNTQEVASGSKEVAEKAAEMSATSTEASENVTQVGEAVKELAEQANILNQDVNEFLKNLGVSTE